MSPPHPSPARRSPTGRQRQRDAERSRDALLDAALDEFSEHGFAGARTQAIADRAGVNKQLINYYFGGKAGLYEALQDRWLAREAQINDGDLAYADLVARYVHHSARNPRLMRLELWESLGAAANESNTPPQAPPDVEAVENITRRATAGELADDLDPRVVLLAVMGMVAAPVALAKSAAEILGMDPTDPAFADHYAEQVRRIVAKLAQLPEHGTAATPAER